MGFVCSIETSPRLSVALEVLNAGVSLDMESFLVAVCCCVCCFVSVCLLLLSCEGLAAEEPLCCGTFRLGLREAIMMFLIPFLNLIVFKNKNN